jgi:hypothetical protein
VSSAISSNALKPRIPTNMVRRPAIDSPLCNSGWSCAASRNSALPIPMPSKMTPICMSTPDIQLTSTALTRAIAMRGKSAQSFLPMSKTALATTATAAIRRPLINGSALSPTLVSPYAKAIMMMAEGRVKPSHAAHAPIRPPRCQPMAKPVWLLVGPGTNWQSASSSA